MLDLLLARFRSIVLHNMLIYRDVCFLALLDGCLIREGVIGGSSRTFPLKSIGKGSTFV